MRKLFWKSGRPALSLASIALLLVMEMNACSDEAAPRGESSGSGGIDYSTAGAPSEAGSSGAVSAGAGGDAGSTDAGGAKADAGAAGSTREVDTSGAAGASGAAGNASSEETAEQKIKRLEESGVLPNLDRSTDVRGPDLDANGVRDDIDRFIAAQAYTSAQRAAAEQLARGLESALVLAGPGAVTTTAARPISLTVGNAIHCVFSRFDAPRGALSPQAVAATYHKLIANTEPRVRAYLRYDHALEGTVYTLPRGDSCAY
ncbi:MAG: hypothetical protein ABIQ16_28880 [Polyangiaceae bacterium]